MPNLVDKIIELLSAADGGLKAKEIARSIGRDITTHEVNHILYSTNGFHRDEDYRWSLTNSPTPSADRIKKDAVMQLLVTPKSLKTYTIDEFEALTDWGDLITGHNGEMNPVLLFTADNGRKIYCDSSYELEALNYLQDHKLCLDIGAQKIDIGYENAFGGHRSYYPDLFVLLADNTVAVLEIKHYLAMSNHSNIEKYSSLKKYCEENGFRYVMVDPWRHYLTFDELKNIPVRQELSEAMINHMSQEDICRFDNDQVLAWYEEYGEGLSLTEFKLEVCSVIIQNNWFNRFKTGFCVYNRPVRMRET